MHAMIIHEVAVSDGVGFRGDASGLYLDEHVMVLFERTCEAVWSRPNLSNEERCLFDAEAETFAGGLSGICKIEDKQTREMALMVAIAALSIGYYHEGNQNVLRELKEKFNKDRIEAASNARARPEVKEIIRQLAEEQRRDGLNLTPYKIAEIIAPTAINRINSLPDCPRDWLVADPDNPTNDEIDKASDRIRQQIRRLSNQDK
jgi:predicted HicB family RNase H-like nuclease